MNHLILQPLHRTPEDQRTSKPAMALIIDGVDECQHNLTATDPHNQSSEKDQIEILSALHQAVCHPSFPFRIIVASRPEPWIRRYFESDTVAKDVAEMFLDSKYKPEADIAIFLEAKFHEIRGRCPYLPAAWPGKGAMEKLVATASGQFIYAAFIIEFINDHSKYPQDQLAIVLNAQPRGEKGPFTELDSLYVSIVKSKPEFVLWLKAFRVLQKHARITPSVWTINRLFESKLGEAHKFLLAFPSLVYVEANVSSCDTAMYEDGNTNDPPYGWTARYAFYHQSFVDFLEDTARCEAAFPEVDQGTVERWIWDRLARILKRTLFEC